MEEKIKEILDLSESYAKDAGLKVNPNRKIAEAIAIGLSKNEEKYGERYCPCRRVTGDKEKDKAIICPCVYHLDEINKDGHCHCFLFVKR
jgi:ferredoxin-thioredoxin reductase catalytic chain